MLPSVVDFSTCLPHWSNTLSAGVSYIGSKYLRPSKENFSNSPEIGMFIKELTNSVGNISSENASSSLALGWNLNMTKLTKESVKTFVGSVSRALGNDLIDYIDHKDHLVLLLWPPISADQHKLIKSMAEYSFPSCYVDVKRKQGRMEINLPKRR